MREETIGGSKRSSYWYNTLAIYNIIESPFRREVCEQHLPHRRRGSDYPHVAFLYGGREDSKQEPPRGDLSAKEGRQRTELHSPKINV